MKQSADSNSFRIRMNERWEKGYIYAVQYTDDGGVLVLTGEHGERKHYVSKYDSTGQLVPSFGVEGKLEFPQELDRQSNVEIALQGEQFLVVQRHVPILGSLQVSRYSVDNGQRDVQFGQEGVFQYDIGGQLPFHAYSRYDRRRDELYIVLNTQEQVERTLAIRVKKEGDLDGTFGQAGTAVVEMPTGVSVGILDVSLRDTGNLLVCFQHAQQPRTSLHYRQLTREGQPDTAFGSGGRVDKTVNAWLLNAFMDDAGTLKYIEKWDKSGKVYGLSGNGDVDPDFATLEFNRELADEKTWVSQISCGVDEDYRIVHASLKSMSTYYLPGAVYQINAKGELDPAFGNQGRFELVATGNAWEAIAPQIFHFPETNDLFVAVSDSVYRIAR